ncbi:hypothetical protein ERD78_17805 [Allopusillimonas soli]|nr:hypothetical protein ERD78_17805 [Allopusillimonas soli]
MGYRPDGTNPCRHVPMRPNRKAMRYVHTEDDPVCKAAEQVVNQRKTITGASPRSAEATA